MDARILIMDEPTSTLPDAEVDILFDIIEQLKARGIAVVFVSHRLEETRRIADRVTVLRDGQFVGEELGRGRQRPADHPHDGRARRRHALPQDGGPAGGDRPVRARSHAQGRAEGHLVRRSPRRGAGPGGLVGAGRTEIARCIFGADRFEQGTITLDGEPVTIRSPQDAVRLGIGYVPEDRKRQGLFLEMSVRDNIAMSVAAPDDARRLRRPRGRDGGGRLLSATASRSARPTSDLAVSRLSGGNQQKVALAKWLALRPKVLILDEPTRGIDVGAKAEVHALIDELAHEGIGIILISSELPEVLNMSDRILVVAEGEIVGELSREEATQERCLELASIKSSRAGSCVAETRTRHGRRRRDTASAASSPVARSARWLVRRPEAGVILVILVLGAYLSVRQPALPLGRQPHEHRPQLLGHRDRRGGHDARPAHRRHRPLGRLGHGARRARGRHGHDLLGSAHPDRHPPRRGRGRGHRPRQRAPRPASAPAALHRHAGHARGGARHRRGHHERAWA